MKEGFRPSMAWWWVGDRLEQVAPNAEYWSIALAHQSQSTRAGCTLPRGRWGPGWCLG